MFLLSGGFLAGSKRIGRATLPVRIVLPARDPGVLDIRRPRLSSPAEEPAGPSIPGIPGERERGAVYSVRSERSAWRALASRFFAAPAMLENYA